MKRIRVPIFIKLLLFTCAILVVVTGVTSYKNSSYFSKVSLQKEEVASMKSASSKAMEVEAIIRSYLDRVRFYSLFLIQNSSEAEWQRVFEGALREDADLVSLSLKRVEDGKLHELKSIYKEEAAKSYNVSESSIKKIELLKRLDFSPTISGDLQIKNISSPGGMPLLWVAAPFMRNSYGEYTFVTSAYFRLDKIQQIFKKIDQQSSTLLDSNGHVVAHPSDIATLKGEKYSNESNWEKVQSSSVKSGLFTAKESEGDVVVSYAKNNLGLTVITESAKELLTLPSVFASKQSYYITALILIGSLFFVLLFSHGFTRRIELLLGMTKAIGRGEFEINAKETITENDELGDLAVAFDDMAHGLKEREKMHNIMNKFHGASIAEQLLLNEVKRHGQKKEAVVFFSDIRGFTSYSESKDPEEVVEMLNEYFEVMVSIITKYGGVVDKFIGDAIMAVWGIPKLKEDSAKNAMHACLEMREALVGLNEKRIGRGKEEVMFGAGLHFGNVISGAIGSEERMEYTVIGDTVNTAARIEASTKAFGTDLLISEALHCQVDDNFILEKAGVVSAKGKSEGMTLYKIRGEVMECGSERIVRTQYSDYEAGKADKIEVTQ